MHSCIYSKSYRDKVSLIDQKQIADWDVYNNTSLIKTKYNYYTPLCYQLVPETDNSLHWGYDSNINYVGARFVKLVSALLGLDKSIEPGYSIVYTFSKIFPIAILLLIIFVIYRRFPIPKRARLFVSNKK